MADLKDYQDAIAGIESRGQPNNGYAARGPVANASGDRAYGRYQIMGANIGPWSREVLGREVTPQEFISSPELQDAIFNGKFGQYVAKYGPEGAARAWLAGEGGMNSNIADVNGTTPDRYAAQFRTNLGQASPQVAAAPSYAPASEIASSVVQQPAPDDSSVPSIWDLLKSDGKRIATQPQQIAESDPLPQMQASPIHRVQGQSMSLLDLLHQRRPRVSRA